MKVYVPNLLYPGISLHIDQMYLRRVNPSTFTQIQDHLPPFGNIFRSLDHALSEAALGLTYFEQAIVQIKCSPTWEERQNEREISSRRTLEIENQILREIGTIEYDVSEAGFQNRRLASERARLIYQQERYDQGHLPQRYILSLPAFYGRAFLYSIDRISKALGKIKPELKRSRKEWTFLTSGEKQGLDKLITKVDLIKKQFDAAFPDLRSVRNSSAHAEDRMQLRAFDKNIPIPQTAGSVLIMSEGIMGNVFTSLMEDGNHGGVEVSEDSLLLACKLIQASIDLFDWDGPGYYSHE